MAVTSTTIDDKDLEWSPDIEYLPGNTIICKASIYCCINKCKNEYPVNNKNWYLIV